MKLIKEIQDILAESYNIKTAEINITYENGHPINYHDEFMKLWLVHMEYITTRQTFPLPKATPQIFDESLNRFISKHPRVQLFIAREEKEMIGFLQAGIAPVSNYGFLSDLHVLESYRRMGIGETLLKNCLEWLKYHGVKEAGLEVTGGNEKVLNFYKRNGFNVDTYTLKKKLGE